MINNIIAGLLAMAFTHLGLIYDLKKKFKLANEVFVMKKYFYDEWIQIVRTLVAIALTAMTVNIWTEAKQWLNDYQIIVFIGMGSFGPIVLSYMIGKTKKRIEGIIDEKTNIADGVNKNQNP